MRYYYLYQIRNKLNNKIYVGVHSTKDMNDGYMGSGQYIRSAIRKYGKENFEKTILELFDSVEEMFLREAEVVTSEFIQRTDTYNLMEGGEGLRAGTDTATRFSNLGHAAQDALGVEYNKHRRRFASGAAMHKLRGTGIYDGTNRQKMIANSKTPEARAKQKETIKRNKMSQGEKNPNYGKVWVHKDQESIRILSSDLDKYISSGWELGSTGEIKEKLGSNSKRRWMSKDGASEFVYDVDIQKHLDDGWVYGRSAESTRQKISKDLSR